MIQEAKVGPGTYGDGALAQPRLGKTGELITGSALGRYYELVSRGLVYGVANQAGITSQAGLSATTPALTLFNPKGSGVNAVLLYAGATFTVAFATAGAIWVAVGTNIAAADVTGTATTAHRNLLLGNGSQPKIQVLLAATLPAAPVAICTLGVGLTGAITTIPQIQTLGKWFDGGLVLAPGANLSIQTGVASGASGTFCEYVWAELPL